MLGCSTYARVRVALMAKLVSHWWQRLSLCREVTLDQLLDFSGKVALVTGGSRGLGREMALALAARGADVVVTSRKAEACEEVASKISAMGRQALAYGCHVGHWDALDGLVDAAYELSLIHI